MSNNHQFSIAVHIAAALGQNKAHIATSAKLARSVNASPSFVRRTLSKLSKSGIVRTSAGKNGRCDLARDPDRITLLDIYKAVEAPQAFSIHTYAPYQSCVTSRGIKPAMENVLARTQRSMEETLGRTRVSDVIAEIARNAELHQAA